MQDINTPQTTGENNSDHIPKENIDQQLPIPENLKQIIEGLPEDQKKGAITGYMMGVSIEQSSFRSPIPPPEILKGYNDIIPGGADRILKMAEKQSEHRIEMEKFWSTKEMNQGGRGQNYAFILAILFLIASVLLILFSYPIAGTILGTTDIVGLATIFIIGRQSQKKDLEDKKS